jgi:predicted nuclease with TOPRIM domain
MGKIKDALVPEVNENKNEMKKQKREAARLDEEQKRRTDQRQRRGAGLGAFTRTGETGILRPVLGG